MYFLFRDGKMITKIAHGETIKQGNTYHLYICFDKETFEPNNTHLRVKFRVPNKSEFTSEIEVERKYIEVFKKLDKSNEVTYNFKDGEYYIVFDCVVDASFIEKGVYDSYGNVEVYSSLYFDDSDEVINLSPFSYFIERTKATNNNNIGINESQYNQLVSEIGKISDKITNIEECVDIKENLLVLSDYEETRHLGTSPASWINYKQTNSNGELDIKIPSTGNTLNEKYIVKLDAPIDTMLVEKYTLSLFVKDSDGNIIFSPNEEGYLDGVKLKYKGLTIDLADFNKHYDTKTFFGDLTYSNDLIIELSDKVILNNRGKHLYFYPYLSKGAIAPNTFKVGKLSQQQQIDEIKAIVSHIDEITPKFDEDNTFNGTNTYNGDVIFKGNVNISKVFEESDEPSYLLVADELGNVSKKSYTSIKDDINTVCDSKFQELEKELLDVKNNKSNSFVYLDVFEMIDEISNLLKLDKESNTLSMLDPNRADLVGKVFTIKEFLEDFDRLYDFSQVAYIKFLDIDEEISEKYIKTGDVILLKKLNTPDWWIRVENGNVTFYRLETSKVDLGPYRKKDDNDFNNSINVLGNVNIVGETTTHKIIGEDDELDEIHHILPNKDGILARMDDIQEARSDLMGAINGKTNEPKVFVQIKKLLQYIFDTFELIDDKIIITYTNDERKTVSLDFLEGDDFTLNPNFIYMIYFKTPLGGNVANFKTGDCVLLTKQDEPDYWIKVTEGTQNIAYSLYPLESRKIEIKDIATKENKFVEITSEDYKRLEENDNIEKDTTYIIVDEEEEISLIDDENISKSTTYSSEKLEDVFSKLKIIKVKAVEELPQDEEEIEANILYLVRMKKKDEYGNEEWSDTYAHYIYDFETQRWYELGHMEINADLSALGDMFDYYPIEWEEFFTNIQLDDTLVLTDAIVLESNGGVLEII